MIRWRRLDIRESGALGPSTWTSWKQDLLVPISVIGASFVVGILIVRVLVFGV